MVVGRTVLGGTLGSSDGISDGIYEGVVLGCSGHEGSLVIVGSIEILGDEDGFKLNEGSELG